MTNTTEQALRDAQASLNEMITEARSLGWEVHPRWMRMMTRARAASHALEEALSLPPSEQEPVAAEFFAYHTEMGAFFLKSLGEARECCVKNLEEERKEANSTGEWCDESAESVRYGIVLGRAKFFPDSEYPESGDYRMVDNPAPQPAEPVAHVSEQARDFFKDLLDRILIDEGKPFIETIMYAFDAWSDSFDLHSPKVEAQPAEVRAVSVQPVPSGEPVCYAHINNAGRVRAVLGDPRGPINTPLYTALQAPSVPDELSAIGEQIRTQDNRCTADPIFVVEQKRTYVGSEGYGESRLEWVDEEGNFADDKVAGHLERNYRTTFVEPKKWRRLFVFDVWEFVTACFTEQGCKDYLALNGHNLNEPRIYAYGSYRNREYQTIRSAMLSAAPKTSVPDEVRKDAEET